MDIPVPGRHLPAEHADSATLGDAHANILRESGIVETLELFPKPVLVTRTNRRIVHANKAALEELGVGGIEDLLGGGFGEAWRCVHTGELPDGCGTGEVCRHCGVAKAFEKGLAGESGTEECGLSVNTASGEKAFDLRLWVRPFDIGGTPHLFIATEDIAAEKRRTYLERVFLHDILNTAAALKGFVALLSMDGVSLSKEEMIGRIGVLSESIVEEINAQRALIAAENNLFEPQPREIGPAEILESVVGAHGTIATSDRRRLVVDANRPEVSMTTDPSLVGRVIGGMVKNALEASRPEEKVTLGCRFDGERLLFWVHNPGTLSDAARAQLFRRSFSTKGEGRGLGAYSMKLFAEKCLQGNVWFTSTPEDGTTFFASFPRALSS